MDLIRFRSVWGFTNVLIFIISLKFYSALPSLTISGSSTYAIENHDLLLSCKSSVVVSGILWTRNDTDISASYIESNVCKSIDTVGNVSLHYRYNCTDNKTFHLIIPGDKILQEDGSKWQCKNSGGGATSNAYIVTVSRSPTSGPVTTGYNNTILYPGNIITLTCTVQGGIPLATLSWTCGGNSVNGTNKGTSTTAINEVILSINSSDNGQTCVCKAEHLLWTTDKTAENQRFVVYYPPTSDMTLSGYNGSKLYVNSIIVLTCQVTGGYPIATLSWSCSRHDYQGTNRSSALTSINELTITMIETLNGKSCICKARHQVPGYEKNVSSLPFLVYYASSKLPVITGYVSGQPVYKGNKQLTCKVSGGYPLTILSMVCNNTVISGTNQSTSTESKYIYNIYVDKTYNKQQCICNGRHPDQNISYNKNTTVTFNVYFSPDTNPVISGYISDHIIYETEHKGLTCYVNGGNPLATITWMCRGVPVSANNQSVEGEARSIITLDIDRNYSKKQCICEAVHIADNYNRQTSVTFIVYYPPTMPLVKNTSSFPWLEGRDESLLCESSPGNPSSSYQWNENGKLLKEQTSPTINFTRLTKDFNRRNYSCKVYNNYTTHTNQHLWSQDTTLNIEYSPVISVGPTPTYLNESNEFNRQCTADGNPIPLIQWHYGKQKSALLQFANTNRNQTGNYTCEAIGISSKYGELKSQKDLTVIVQFPPTVSVFIPTPLEEGKTTDITCTASGIPEKYFYTGWTQTYNGIVIRRGLNFGTLNAGNSRLTLSDLSYQDIGVYICTAHNTIKNRNGILEQKGSAYLNITFSPVFTQNSQRKFYAELGHNVDMEIPFFSIPSLDNSSVTIHKLDKNNSDFERSVFSLEINQANLSITFHGRKINVKGQKAIFTLPSFQKDHKGNYSVNFTTPDGLSSTFELEVIPSGPPGQPRNLRVLSNTKTSITVTWISDFNGGYPQTFVILYYINQEGDLKEVRVNEIEDQNNYNYTINHLAPGKEYLIWIYSFNQKGNSTHSYELNEPLRRKTESVQPEKNHMGIVFGAVSAVVAILLIVLVVVSLLVRRHRRTKDNEGSLINGTSNRRSLDDSDIEGMRDNVLYEPAGPNYVNPKTRQGKTNANAGKGSDIYSEVRKPGKQNDEQNKFYAVVQKKQKSTAASSDIYSKVNKTKKYDADNVYENMETSFNRQEKHSNSDKIPGPSGESNKKPAKPPKPTAQKRNKDGLLYADLILEDPTMVGNQYVIRGLEDKTDYAEVDFSKKAKPLPPETNENNSDDTTTK